MKEKFDLILEYVCEKLNLKLEDVQSKSQKTEFVVARSIVIYWFKSLYYKEVTYKEIGRWMDLDHSTIINAYNNMEKDIYGVKDLMPEIGKSLGHIYFAFMNLTYDVKPRYRVVK